MDLENMTTGQLDDQLDLYEGKLAGAKDALKRAEDELYYAEARKGGDPLLDAERDAALLRHRPAYDVAAKAARDAARKAVEATNRVAKITGNAELTLSPQATATAATRLPLVQAEAAQLDVPGLGRRLQAAILDGDPATLYVWVMAGEARMQAEKSRGSSGPLDDQNEAVKMAVAKQLRDARAKLTAFPSRTLNERAAQIRSDSHRLEGRAQKRVLAQGEKRAVPERVYAFQGPNDVAWPDD